MTLNAASANVCPARMSFNVFDKLNYQKLIYMETNLRKILIRMSKYAIYGIVIQVSLYSFVFALDVDAQRKSLREINVDVVLHDDQIKDVFEKIESTTDFRFSYRKSQIPKTTITVEEGEKSLAELLQIVSQQSSLSFRRIDGTIHVKPLEKGEKHVVEVLIQESTISGKVLDENGEPLPGATVIEKGTSNGSITDVEGNFTLNVGEEAVLLVSFVGYKSQEITVGEQTQFDVSLQPDYGSLEEVVVVGYGTQKRSDVTGSVVSVPKDRLQNLPVTNLMHAIQGTTAGLNIIQDSSVPGSSGTMQIRGVNSINANTSPFIVLDGVPFFGQTNDINPNDIASIEVLKDASAVAIYGTRGANGVILITTKRGSDINAKPTVRYSGYAGFEGISNPLEPMGPDQYVQKYADFLTANDLSQTAVLPNAAEVENYNAGVTSDWMDLATQPGRLQEHNLSVSGGTKSLQYYVSGSRLTQDGVVKGYQFKKTTFRLNLDSKINEYFEVGTSAFFTENNSDGGRVNLLEATAMSPYSVPKDDNGEYIIYPMEPEQLFLNPLLGLTVDRVDRDRNLTGSGYAEIKAPFLEGLKYKLNGSYTYKLNRWSQYAGRAANDQSGTGQIAYDESSNWVVENIISYSQDFNKHHVDVTALYSAQKVDDFGFYAQSKNFTNDGLSYFNLSAGNTQSNDSYGNGYTLASQMGRINYSYDSRYLLTLTARRDGYSAFGANTNKYGLFPSIALAWNAANENFLSGSAVVNQLKVRFSHGETGNQAIGVNQTVSTADAVQYPFGGTALTGIIYNTLGNPNLNWETTTSTNGAVDFGFIQSRISGTIEVYKTVTEDILLRRNLPTTSGFSNVWANLGKMQNVGFELTLNTVNFEQGNFSWETGVNFSTYRNKILELYGDGQDDIGNRWFIGEPLRVVYDYEKTGIWQSDEDPSDMDPVAIPGDLKFKDQDGDGQITADDRVIIGQRDPKWIGGLTNTFTYKNFNLSVFIQTSQGGLRSNRDLSYADEAGRRNLPQGFEYWTAENPSNYWPSLASYKNYRGYSFSEDYSYVRIKDVRLSYVLPADLLSKYGIGNMIVYVAGRNLHTFTDWFGWDPEMNYDSRGSGNWRNNYPLVRTISLGLNVSL